MFSRSQALGLMFVVLLGRNAAFADGAPDLAPGTNIRLTGMRGNCEVPGVVILDDHRITFGGEVVNHRDVSDSPGTFSLIEVDLVDGRTLLIPLLGASVEGRLVTVDARAITVLRGNQREVTIPREAIGAIAGAASGGERWESVEPGKMRVSVVPVAKGVGVSMSSDSRVGVGADRDGAFRRESNRVRVG